MISKDVEELFDHYCQVVNSDEAAAILTLAEVLRRGEQAAAALLQETSDQLGN